MEKIKGGTLSGKLERPGGELERPGGEAEFPS
jgi:hypothetical protein